MRLLNIKQDKVVMIRAFSLIELMVVIAIVAVLAAVAIPSYKDYVVKTKLTNTMNIAHKLINEVNVYYNTNGALPTRMSQLGHSEGGGTINNGQIFSTSDFNSGIIVETGFWGSGACPVPASVTSPGSGCAWIGIDKTFLGLASDGMLSFAVTIGSNGILSWQCFTYNNGGWTTIPTKYLPTSCLY